MGWARAGGTEEAKPHKVDNCCGHRAEGSFTLFVSLLCETENRAGNRSAGDKRHTVALHVLMKTLALHGIRKKRHILTK